MEYQRILNVLNEASHPKFVTRNWNIVNDQSNASYSLGSEIIYRTEVFKSNLWDYNGSYILEGDIMISGNIAARLACKSCAPFITCITIDDAEDLD